MTTNGTEHETMIERVAKAIWEANAPPGAPEWEGLQGSDQYMVEIIAIECIKAMKEPTEAMVLASGMCGDTTGVEEAQQCWKHMIEAALEEV